MYSFDEIQKVDPEIEMCIRDRTGADECSGSAAVFKVT